jgi:hypothetical protein
VEDKIAVGENGGNRISDALSGISTINKPKISAQRKKGFMRMPIMHVVKKAELT